MEFELIPTPLPQFEQLYNLPPDTWLCINMGPRGSGKSYEGSKFGVLNVITAKKRVAILRDEASTITQSILHEMKLRYNEINEKLRGRLDLHFEFQTNVLKDRKTGLDLIFTKGFSTSSKGKQTTLKSLADVDIAIIEEFEDITDEKKFNSFKDSIRNKGSFILINSNIPNKNHWFIKRFFTLEPHEKHDGYFHLIPKKIKGVVYITSSFRGNTHLNEVTANNYALYGDPESPLYDLHYYLTEIEGLTTDGKKGQIYKGWKKCTSKEFDELPYRTIYGLDFGYSNDPCSITAYKFHNNTVWGKELVYEPSLTNIDIAKKLIDNGYKDGELIIADSAEPKSIAQLRNVDGSLNNIDNYPQLKKGFNISPALKGADSINFGIKTIKGLEVYFTDTSSNLWSEEYANYCWALDNLGNPTDTPIDKHNHELDQFRYVVSAKGRLF